MAGPASITLFRSEDATINISILARQAARVLAAALDGATVRLLMRRYPETGAPLFQIASGTPIGGIRLDVVADGVCRLVLPKTFWADKPARRFSVECFLESPAGTQRVGEVLLDVTE